MILDQNKVSKYPTFPSMSKSRGSNTDTWVRVTLLVAKFVQRTISKTSTLAHFPSNGTLLTFYLLDGRSFCLWCWWMLFNDHYYDPPDICKLGILVKCSSQCKDLLGLLSSLFRGTKNRVRLLFALSWCRMGCFFPKIKPNHQN